MFNKLLFVFIGGGLGSVIRYIITRYVTHKYESDLPLGTFIVNVIGSLLLGVIVGVAQKNNWVESHILVLFTAGFCGGFTTFSAFALENVLLMKQGDVAIVLFYTTLSIILGLVAAFLGLWLTR